VSSHAKLSRSDLPVFSLAPPFSRDSTNPRRSLLNFTLRDRNCQVRLSKETGGSCSSHFHTLLVALCIDLLPSTAPFTLCIEGEFLESINVHLLFLPRFPDAWGRCFFFFLQSYWTFAVSAFFCGGGCSDLKVCILSVFFSPFFALVTDSHPNNLLPFRLLLIQDRKKPLFPPRRFLPLSRLLLPSPKIRLVYSAGERLVK